MNIVSIYALLLLVPQVSAQEVAEQEATQAIEQEDAQYIRFGYEKWDGEWVPGSYIPRLKKGLIFVGDQWLTPSEKEKMDQGWILRDSEWFAPEEAAKVNEGLFKIFDEWVSLQDADEYHSTLDSPWKVVSTHFNIASNLPYETIQAQKGYAEFAYERLYQIFGIDIEEKMDLLIIGSINAYNNFMTNYGGHHSSVWAGCIADQDPQQRGVCLYDKGFAYYYLSHAVAHVYINKISKGATMPNWFVEGVATYVSRYYDAATTAWSLENLFRRGELDPINEFTQNYLMDANEMGESQKDLLQAGLLVAYCLDGGDERLRQEFIALARLVPTGNEKKIQWALVDLLSSREDLHKRLNAYAGQE